MNTENSKTDELHRFRLSLVEHKNIALANLSIYHTWKNIKLHITTINLKFLIQLGMMKLICLMDLILLQTYKTTFNLSSRNTKL